MVIIFESSEDTDKYKQENKDYILVKNIQRGCNY